MLSMSSSYTACQRIKAHTNERARRRSRSDCCCVATAAPDLDVAPLAVLSRVSCLAHHLDNARAAAFEAHDLESWEFDVLAALRRAGSPFCLSPSELLRQTMVTSGTMTNRID